MKLYSGLHRLLFFTFVLVSSCATSYGAGLKEKLCATFSCCCLCPKKLVPLRPIYKEPLQQSQSRRKNSQSPDSNSQSDGSSDSDIHKFESASPIFHEIIAQTKPNSNQFDIEAIAQPEPNSNQFDITDMGGRPAQPSPHDSDHEGQ